MQAKDVIFSIFRRSVAGLTLGLTVFAGAVTAQTYQPVPGAVPDQHPMAPMGMQAPMNPMALLSAVAEWPSLSGP